MKLVDGVILENYGEELHLLKQILLKDGNYMKDQTFLDLLKFVVVNRDATKEEIEFFSKKNELDIDLIKYTFDFFYLKNKIEILSLDLLKHLVAPSKFNKEEDVIEYIFAKIDSKNDNSEIFKDLSVTDLISKEAISDLNNILNRILVNNDLRSSISRIKRELKNINNLKHANVRFKKHLDQFKEYKDFFECYVRFFYPFVAIYDPHTLIELVTINEEHIEIRYDI